MVLRVVLLEEAVCMCYRGRVVQICVGLYLFSLVKQFVSFKYFIV